VPAQASREIERQGGNRGQRDREKEVEKDWSSPSSCQGSRIACSHATKGRLLFSIASVGRSSWSAVEQKKR